MMAQHKGPRHTGGYRPNNQAALDAAEQSLSGVPARKIDRMTLTRIRPDKEQPRDYFPPAAIHSRAQSMEADRQLDPVKVRPLTAEEIAVRTLDEIRAGVDHQLIDGEVRYWGAIENGWKQIDVEVVRDLPKDPALMRERVLDIQNAQNIEHEFMSLSAICRSITRYKDEFKRTYKFLADNQFRKLANGDESWVGDRYRLWAKIKPTAHFDDTDYEADAAEMRELAQKYADVLTHLEIIARVKETSLRRSLIAATKEGSSAIGLRRMIQEYQLLHAPAPEPVRLPVLKIPPGGIVLNQPAPPATEADLDAAVDEPEPTQEELSRQAADLDWHAREKEPDFDASTFSGNLHTAHGVLEMARHQLPVALEHRYTNQRAKDAFLTTIAGIRTLLDEFEAKIKNEDPKP